MPLSLPMEARTCLSEATQDPPNYGAPLARLLGLSALFLVEPFHWVSAVPLRVHNPINVVPMLVL